MKIVIMICLYITAAIGDSALWVVEQMDEVFNCLVDKLRAIERRCGAHERRILRDAEEPV